MNEKMLPNEIGGEIKRRATKTDGFVRERGQKGGDAENGKEKLNTIENKRENHQHFFGKTSQKRGREECFKV